MYKLVLRKSGGNISWELIPLEKGLTKYSGSRSTIRLALAAAHLAVPKQNIRFAYMERD